MKKRKKKSKTMRKNTKNIEINPPVVLPTKPQVDPDFIPHKEKETIVPEIPEIIPNTPPDIRPTIEPDID